MIQAKLQFTSTGSGRGKKEEMEKCIATIGSTAATAAIAAIVATLLFI